MVHNAYVHHNFTESSAEAVTWSMVEANTGIICASLLALKPLIVYFFPKTVEVRRPPRWSTTLNTVPITPSGSDLERATPEHNEKVDRAADVDKLEKIPEEEDSDELTLVGTRQSWADVATKQERTRSWGEQTILDMEGTISIARPEPVASSPMTGHVAGEEDEIREQRAALDLRRGPSLARGMKSDHLV